MDYSPPGSSVHGISQARIIKEVAISPFPGSSQPRDQTGSPALAGRFFTVKPAESFITQGLCSAKLEISLLCPSWSSAGSGGWIPISVSLCPACQPWGRWSCHHPLGWAHFHASRSAVCPLPCQHPQRLVCPLSGSNLHQPCFHLGLHLCATRGSPLQTITPLPHWNVDKYLNALFLPRQCTLSNCSQAHLLSIPHNHLYPRSAISTCNGTRGFLPRSQSPRQPCIMQAKALLLWIPVTCKG